MLPMLFESTSDSLIQRIKADGSASTAHPGYARIPTEATSDGTKARRAMAQCIADTLDGNFLHLVDEKLAERFHIDTYRAMALQSGTRASHNLMAEAVDRLDESTWPSARYELQEKGAEPADDVESAAHEELEKEIEHWVDVAKPDQLAQQISRLGWAHSAVCVMPWVAPLERTKSRKFGWVTLHPGQFDLVPSKQLPGEWEALRTFDPCGDKDDVEYMTEWRAETVCRYKRRRAMQAYQEEGQWVKIGEEPNPFGLVPAAIFRAVPGKLWSDSYGPMLLEATIEVNAAQTLLTYNGPGQVKVMLGALDGMRSGQVLRHGALVDAPGTAALQVADLTTDVQRFAQTYVRDERTAVAVALGLPADEFYSTAVAPSGESLKLRYWTRTLRARKHRDALRPVMEELFWLSLHVIQVAQGFVGKDEYGAAVQLPPIEGFETPDLLPPYDPSKAFASQPYALSIDVEDLQPPETQQEREARIDFDISMGFTTAAKILQAENPDVTDPEDVIKENLAKTRDMRQAKVDAAPPAQAGGALPRPSIGGTVTAAPEPDSMDEEDQPENEG